MDTGAMVAVEGTSLIRGGRVSAIECAGERGAVLTGRSHLAERERASERAGRRADRSAPPSSERERGKRERVWDSADRRGPPVREGRARTRLGAS
jgi:hypothetical protein